jgi:DNA-binding NtrC family response regulator
MSPKLQVKLLRVLQDRTFEPVGSSKTVRVDVRIVAATNQDLEQLIKEKRFREDLFYRLSVLPIEVPPLRERREDIPLLIHHFLDAANQERETTIESVSDAAMQRLLEYDWPGNVRELENLMERLVVLCRDPEIGVEDLPPQFHQRSEPAQTAPRVPPSGLSFNQVVDQFEGDLILQALERTHWNKNQAARLLGLNRTTLLEKIRKKGLEPPAS